MKYSVLLCFLEYEVAGIEVGKGSSVSFYHEGSAGGAVSKNHVRVFDSFLKRDDGVSFKEPVADSVLHYRRGKDQLSMVESADRGLRIEIKFTKRF